jgi:hypothetical protein
MHRRELVAMRAQLCLDYRNKSESAAKRKRDSNNVSDDVSDDVRHDDEARPSFVVGRSDLWEVGHIEEHRLVLRIKTLGIIVERTNRLLLIARFLEPYVLEVDALDIVGQYAEKLRQFGF